MSGEIEKSVVEPPDDDDRSESNENLSFERSVMETAINCSDPLEVSMYFTGVRCTSIYFYLILPSPSTP